LLSKLEQIQVGRAWFFRARVGLGLCTLCSGMKNSLNKSGFIWALALLYKWKVGLRPDPPLRAEMDRNWRYETELFDSV
jgi:hypothetical protein